VIEADVVTLPPLTPLLEQHGYWAIALLVFVESFGVPAPGQTAIIFGAAVAARGHLNIFGVAVIAFFAAVTGDSLGYIIGRVGGHRLILRFGRYIRLTPVRLARAEAFMARHGPKVVTIARFIDGLRQLNGVIAGAMEMPWHRFLLFNSIGAFLWVGIWSTAGYLAGDNLPAILETIHRYQWYAVAVLVLLVGAYVLFHISRRRRHAREESKIAEGEPE
jgi:membrane protein DedA with SNARE-associated domain